VDDGERLLFERYRRDPVDGEGANGFVFGDVGQQIETALGEREAVGMDEVGLGTLARLRMIGEAGLALVQRRLERAGDERLLLRVVRTARRIGLGRDDARQLYEKAASLSPWNQTFLNNLAYQHFLAGEYKKADELYVRLLSLDSRYLLSYFMLSQAVLMQGDNQRAFRTLRLLDDVLPRLLVGAWDV